MNIIESYKLVIKNMLEKKGRVFLTLAGIVIGIFTFTFFIFVSQGLQNAIFEQFNSLGANSLAVKKVGQADGPPTGDGLTDTDVAKIKQVVREYKYIAPGIFYTAKFEYGKDNIDALALAYPDEYLEDVKDDLGLDILEGRDLRAGDKGSLVLGYKIAKEGFDDIELQVGNSLKVGDKNFRVIGISEEKGDLFIDNSIMMSFDDIKEVSDQDTYSVIRINFLEGADLDYYQEQIENKLNPNGEEKNVEVTSSAQVIEQFNQIIGLLTGIIGFISSVALFVGGINVMNTMYSNVLERINEISVMKALGARNGDVLSLFLIESSILGLIGGLIGFFGAYFLAEIVSYLIINFSGYNVPIYFDFTLFLIVILGTTFIATIFGTYPAIRAAQINPADNLRDE